MFYLINMFEFAAEFSDSIVNISIASLYIFFGFVAGRFAGKFFGKIFIKMNLEELTSKLGINNPRAFVEKLVSYIIYLIAIMFAIREIIASPLLGEILNIVLAVLIIALCFLAVAISFKEFLPNLIIGFYLRAVKHLKPSDKINLAGVKGVVKKVGLFETEITTDDKEIMFFPNSYFARRIKLRLKR